MKISLIDIMLCSLAITLLVAGAVATVAVAVSPIARAWCGDYHVLVDLFAGLAAYGGLAGLAIRLLLRLRPLEHGEFAMTDPNAVYWKLLTVIHRLGEWALRPFTNVLSQPTITWLFGARVGAGAVLGGAVEDPFLVTIGAGAVLGGDSLVAASTTVGGRVILRPVDIGAEALVGVKAVVLAGTVLGAGAKLAGGSIALPGTVIPAGETWRGNPARRWTSAQG